MLAEKPKQILEEAVKIKYAEQLCQDDTTTKSIIFGLISSNADDVIKEITESFHAYALRLKMEGYEIVKGEGMP